MQMIMSLNHSGTLYIRISSDLEKLQFLKVVFYLIEKPPQKVKPFQRMRMFRNQSDTL